MEIGKAADIFIFDKNFNIKKVFINGKKYCATAMKSTSKLLRGNAVTGIATVAIMSAGDVINIFRGRISAAQLFKNLVNTTADVASTAASKVSQAVTDEFIEDDGKEMVRILESEFQEVATDYILNKSEGEQVADNLKDKLDGSTLKDMYASKDRNNFARELIVSCTEPVVVNRETIYLPTNEDYIHGLKNILKKKIRAEEFLQPLFF